MNDVRLGDVTGTTLVPAGTRPPVIVVRERQEMCITSHGIVMSTEEIDA